MTSPQAVLSQALQMSDDPSSTSAVPRAASPFEPMGNSTMASRAASPFEQQCHDKAIVFLKRECAKPANVHLLHPVDAASFGYTVAGLELFKKYQSAIEQPLCLKQVETAATANPLYILHDLERDLELIRQNTCLSCGSSSSHQRGLILDVPALGDLATSLLQRAQRISKRKQKSNELSQLLEGSRLGVLDGGASDPCSMDSSMDSAAAAGCFQMMHCSKSDNLSDVMNSCAGALATVASTLTSISTVASALRVANTHTMGELAQMRQRLCDTLNGLRNPPPHNSEAVAELLLKLGVILGCAQQTQALRIQLENNHDYTAQAVSVQTLDRLVTDVVHSNLMMRQAPATWNDDNDAALNAALAEDAAQAGARMRLKADEYDSEDELLEW